MSQESQRANLFTDWLDKIDGKNRVKAVCKPCWELKYCPYGSLVEDFPLLENDDSKRCRIFGHMCPVFQIAEPFTETRELRNISRNIPRPTQFRVLRRDNSVCRSCNLPIADEDIHFDHIIPWSKGGSSDESNIQLLCSKCNQKKLAKYESEHLINDVFDHLIEPVNHEIVSLLLLFVEFAHDFHSTEGHFPLAEDIGAHLNDGEVTLAEEQAKEIIADIDIFFTDDPPHELRKEVFDALRVRWGFENGVVRKLRFIANQYELEIEDLLKAEISLINRLGWTVELNKTSKKKWLST